MKADGRTDRCRVDRELLLLLHGGPRQRAYLVCQGIVSGMTLDEIKIVVDQATDAMLGALRERGCDRLNVEELEKVEAIIIGSLARSGLLYPAD
jgi:hypothetical protein